MKKHHFGLVLALALALFAFAPMAASADDYFVEDDDYTEGEEVVNVFFQEAEYTIMIESIERNGKSFDWGWTLTPDWNPNWASAEPVDTGKKKRRKKKRKKKPGTDDEPKELGFQLGDYSTIRIPEVENHAGIVRDEELEEIRDVMGTLAEQLGWEATMSDSANADLEIKGVVVDMDRQGGGFGFIQVQPFIEMEVRIRDLKNNKDLVLIRNQEHAGTPSDAATEMFSDLIQFLRN